MDADLHVPWHFSFFTCAAINFFFIPVVFIIIFLFIVSYAVLLKLLSEGGRCHSLCVVSACARMRTTMPNFLLAHNQNLVVFRGLSLPNVTIY